VQKGAIAVLTQQVVSGYAGFMDMTVVCKTYHFPACLLILAALWMSAWMPDERAWAEIGNGNGAGVDVLWRRVSYGSG